jgi:hypothetical protein
MQAQDFGSCQWEQDWEENAIMKPGIRERGSSIYRNTPVLRESLTSQHCPLRTRVTSLPCLAGAEPCVMRPPLDPFCNKDVKLRGHTVYSVLSLLLLSEIYSFIIKKSFWAYLTNFLPLLLFFLIICVWQPIMTASHHRMEKDDFPIVCGVL